MINSKYINVGELREASRLLRAGDEIFLSGTVYCARDAAHKRIMALIEKAEPLPFPIKDAVIYYCGPTAAKPGMTIGSAGPTTSTRMDGFMETMIDLGLLATIGKGARKDHVNKKMLENGVLYLCAMGGAGAIAAESITECEVIAFPELGCESVKRMIFKNFPLVVGNDIYGGTLFAK